VRNSPDLWKVIHSALRIWLMVETGQIEAKPIFTQNLFCVACK
jgi:hypothetical protein